ncbi:MAG: vWA domain-containing protein [Phycisphaerales bacterium]
MLLLKTMLIGALLSAQSAEPAGSPRIPDRPEPCYVVVAIDISGNMESSDAAAPDAAGRRQTLRDDGQLVFLQLLPFLRSDLYVGVAHFSDKVRYALPSAQTGHLLPWGQTFLTESACRNMVRSVEFQGAFRADIAESMSWAASRIEAARKQYGPGSGKLIVLTNGAPRDSARELDRGRGPLLAMAKRVAEQRIEVYPVLIDRASVQSAGRQPRLSADEIAAEDLMHSVASATGGKAYRLASDFGFADILMDAFGLGMRVRDDLLVGRYDWAVVAVGEPVKSAVVEPTGGPDKALRALTMDSSMEATSGIRANVIVSPGYQTTVVRRPDAGDLVSRFWQGKWTLGSSDAKTQPAVRIYRIPDFLVQLELKPELPWWLHEQVQVKARLLERHKKGPDSRVATSGADADRLSVRVQANSADKADSVVVSLGHWIEPARLYETEPFTIGRAGLYKLGCELRHAIGDANVPILQLTNDVYVHSECVGISIVDAATNAVLQEVPPTPGATVNIDMPGGRDVYFRISGKGEFKVEPLSGVLRLSPLSQTDWPLRKDDQGSLLAGPIRLIEREEQLVAWAELEVRTHVGIRRILLPRFDLVYQPAPMRIECRFTDSREALWVGEIHKQPVVISAFPVFERFRDATLRLFPGRLPQTRIRTVDMRSGVTQEAGPDTRVLEPPQAGGYEGRTVTATYFVESAIPIPSADKCEIDVGPAMANLQGTTKTYAIVDPVAQGLFKWTVTQPGQPLARQGQISEALFCGEPIQFHAEWRADQNVSAVRFEIPQTDSNEPVLVDLPVTAGTSKADTEQMLTGLSRGQTVPVYVHVTMQPSGADHVLQVKLQGGQFRAEDRRVTLEDLKVGEGALMDMTAYTWEPVEIPLRAVFSGYTATDPRHNASVDQFKKSCVVTVTAKAGDVRNVSETIEWTSVTPAEGPDRRCELIGHATYMPDAPGRATVELTAETPAVQGASKSSPRRVSAHLLAKLPRLAVTIRKLTATAEESVFDSRRWITGEGGVSALLTRFSARLRVEVRSSDWAATGQSRPWRTAIRVLRRPSANAEWITEFSDTGELTGEGTFLREVQIAANGEYILEVTGTDPQSGRRTAFLQTPVVALIQPHEIKPTAVPPAWLTSRVRQWPFEYQVTLHQEPGDGGQPQAVAFQLQLPGQTETWLEGTSTVLSQTSEARQLLVKAPRFLPAAQGLRDGVVQFKLSSQGLDLLRWDCPDIRVIPPVLERLAISHRSNANSIALTGAEMVFDGSAELWVRPQFRAAPELEGRWIPSESTVFLWRHRTGETAGSQVDARTLESLQDQAAARTAGSSIKVFKVENPGSNRAVRVMPRRAGLQLVGWPRRPAREQYSMVASVVYRSQEAAAGETPADRVVAEWSDLHTVQLDMPWVVPLCWWPVAAFLVIAILATVLKLFVPSPSRLALDMRLEENIAVVEPTRFDNPVLVDLQETSLAKDMQLYTRYLRSRWNGSPAALIAGPIRVFFRRALYPRRWAWTAVIPRVRGDARSVRTGLMCVWTGLGARSGRVWSCQDGSLALPPEGQVKTVHLDLPYRVDNVNRTMRVAIRIGRMARRET